MSIRVRIVQENQTVADLPAWDGPVPRKGDYLFHPPFGDQSPEHLSAIAGSVKTVTWRLYDRTPQGTGFTQTAQPYVELAI